MSFSIEAKGVGSVLQAMTLSRDDRSSVTWTVYGTSNTWYTAPSWIIYFTNLHGGQIRR